ncbi:hypothetical protein LG204_11620 [Methylovorus menthalis]|nr:hypothetical protein [Methylovorus menthalis]
MFGSHHSPEARRTLSCQSLMS